jgi:signal peptidase I
MWLSVKTRIKFENFLLDLFDMVSFLVFVLWIVLFIRFFVANPYTVVWSSMAPTFIEKDFIIVDKISQKLWRLDRGDVIVFVPQWKTIPYIKRIIWLPWETVKIKEWWVWICDSEWENCERLQETYLPEGLETKTRCGITEFQIEKWYFVMWDNRWASTDSLCCFGLGCYDGATYEVLDEDMIGKVLFRVFPNFGTDFYWK